MIDFHDVLQIDNQILLNGYMVGDKIKKCFWLDDGTCNCGYDVKKYIESYKEEGGSK